MKYKYYINIYVVKYGFKKRCYTVGEKIIMIVLDGGAL